VNFQEVVHSIRTGNADVAKPQRFAEDRMDTHKNARLTPKGREEMVRAVVDRGMTKAADNTCPFRKLSPFDSQSAANQNMIAG
jgi:hypothetical protein